MPSWTNSSWQHNSNKLASGKRGAVQSSSARPCSGSPAVDVVGLHIGLDMATWWSADDAFFEGLRDREVLTALVAEVGGTEVAAANAKEKGATLKAIIRDHLDGENGRTKVEGGVPWWMAFPPAAYLGLKLDDPSFAAPIYANLFDDEGSKEFSLIWSRTNRKSGD